MRNIKRIIGIVVVIALSICGIGVCNFCLVDDAGRFTRIMMHELYNQDDVDLLIVGASHIYRACDPEIIGQKTGYSVFDASSSGQEPDGSLALIREAIELYDIKAVYYNLSYTELSKVVNYKERVSMVHTNIIADYMRPSVDKIKYLMSASTADHYMNDLIPARRSADKVFNKRFVVKNVKAKLSDEYKNHDYSLVSSGHNIYEGKGYISSDIKSRESGFYSETGYERAEVVDISSDALSSIEEIVALCKEKGIEIVFFDVKCPGYILASNGNYDDFHDYIKEFADNEDVTYVDFSYIKDEYMPADEAYYKDVNHYNIYGAEIFSNLLGDYINGNVPEDAFYTRTDDRLVEAGAKLYGVAYSSEQIDNMTDMRLIEYGMDNYEFKIDVDPADGGDRISIQDYSNNKEFAIAADLEGKLIIRYRCIDNPKDVKVVKIRL